MKRNITLIIALIISININAKPLPYLQADLSIDKRLEDLMNRMNLEDKVGQMCQYVGLEHMRHVEEIRRTEGVDETSDAFGFYKGMTSKDVEALVKRGLIGSFLHVADYQEANDLQKLANKSPLKIPLLIAVDAIHGHGLYMPGATVFPTPIGLSSTWDLELVEEVARVTAKEMRATGYHWTFSPNVDVARDPRWGRVGETAGEDPYLVSLMGAAMVKGYQGENFSDPNHVIACAKHFIAGSQPLRGLNFSPMDVSERNLREIWLPPYKKVLDQGCYTFMAAHNELNGIPCHANDYLLTDILRDEWQFKGFVVTDWMDVSRIHNTHKVTETRKEADILAVNAGIDMNMHGPIFSDHIIEGVNEGQISEEKIDGIVRRILYAKFQLGLFENRLVNKKQVKNTILNPEHKKLALKSANKSLVLLKNENNLLPLNKDLKTILVTGFNANNETILGDWAVPQPEEQLMTVLEGIQQTVSIETDVLYQPVENLRSIQDEEIDNAVELAKKAEVAVVVAGENSMRHEWDERTCGENVARTSLGLFGRQLELIQKIHATGTPVVVVLVNGRPLAIQWCKDHIPAILEAWEPGLLGGLAIAQTLFGENNPSGKLTVTFPKSVGQIPCFYNHKPSAYFRTFADAETGFLYPFGYGLSYTTFEYSNLQVPNIVEKGEKVYISVDIMNAGDRDGEEVAILFTNDVYSSVTTPVKEMKAFKRIYLKKGQKQTVQFEIKPEQLTLFDRNFIPVQESGTFDVMVQNLKGNFNVK